MNAKQLIVKLVRDHVEVDPLEWITQESYDKAVDRYNRKIGVKQ